MRGYPTLLLAFLAPGLIAAPETGPAASLQGAVALGRSPVLRWPDWSDYRGHVAGFYMQLGWQQAWSQDGLPTPQARALATILANADLKGLRATDYDGDRWAASMDGLAKALEPGRAALDVAFTVCVMRYLSDLRLGRINPARLDQGFGGTSRRAFLTAAALELTSAAEPGPLLLEPAQPGYRALLAHLPRYLELAKGPAPPFRPVKGLAPGGAYAGAEALATHLAALGDLDPALAKALPAGLYAPDLASAVAHFQARHGLEPDGKLGPRTAFELSVPLSRRLDQIRLTLERWRWAERDPTPRMIVVNIPAFNLSALSMEAAPAPPAGPALPSRWEAAYHTDLWMKVVVGMALKHQTHLLTGRVEAVIFRPTWDVPRSMLLKELLPDLRKHPALLARGGYEIVPTAGGTGGSAVTPGALRNLAAGTSRLVQQPGPRNALGHVKFLFSNPFEIYLHDTPARTAFASSRRDFSHGCIRLEHPADLAAWILRDTPGWAPAAVQSAMTAEGPPSTVPVRAPIQVLIVYGTATVDGTGTIYFYDDIYRNDRQLAKALATGYPYLW